MSIRRYIPVNLGGCHWAINDTQRNFSCSVVHEKQADAEDTAKWLNDRAVGYLSLAKFEGGANWPTADEEHFWRRVRVSSPERAAHIERANLAAYHGDIDGDFDY